MGHPLSLTVSGGSALEHTKCRPELEEFDPLSPISILLAGRHAGVNDGGTVSSVSPSGRGAGNVDDNGTVALIASEPYAQVRAQHPCSPPITLSPPPSVPKAKEVQLVHNHHANKSHGSLGYDDQREPAAFVMFSDLPMQCHQDLQPNRRLSVPVLDRPDGSLKAGRPSGVYAAVPDPTDPRHHYLEEVVVPGGTAGPAPFYSVPVNPGNSVPRPNIHTAPHHALDVDRRGRPVCARCKEPYVDGSSHFAKDCFVKRGPCHYCGSINHKRKKCPQLKKALANQ